MKKKEENIQIVLDMLRRIDMTHSVASGPSFHIPQHQCCVCVNGLMMPFRDVCVCVEAVESMGANLTTAARADFMLLNMLLLLLLKGLLLLLLLPPFSKE